MTARGADTAARRRAKRAGPWLLALTALLGLAGVAVYGAGRQSFPHLEHAGMFPYCTGCHEGVPSGDRATFYPPPESCAGCHDGVERERVEWTPPGPDVDNLAFSHVGHAAEIAAQTEQELDCAVCHTAAGAPRMAVEPPVAQRCLACHAHEARDHLVDADCSTCHVPLAETRFTRTSIAALPKPETHARADFLPEWHGELAEAEPARCATCHTQDLCASCHVEVGRYPAIAQLPQAPPALDLPPFEAHYFEPSSHREPDWLEEHGEPAAAAGATCSTCHTRESCATCHAVEPPAVAALPRGAGVRAPGVSTQLRAPASHFAPLFEREHGTIAAAGASSCAGCHTRTWCEECHNAPASGSAAALVSMGGRGLTHAAADTPRSRGEPARARTGASFHPPNFAARHPAEAWGRTLECSSCHDTQAFCRACHTQAGMTSSGRLGSGFHDAQPLWLLRHGQAARQGLESCASCHAQRDCMQCHSQLGSFQISPHGKDFDPERFRGRNQQVCFACHISDPFGRRNP